ncbi:hypothetical protein FQA47_015557, partial [Oryzias melastigma]
QTLLCFLLLRGSCLLHLETAAAVSLLDTTKWFYYYDDLTPFTINYEDFFIEKESISEPKSTKILPTEQPEPPDVLFYFRLILVSTIAILFIFPTVCFTLIWKKRVSSAGRSSGEQYVC